MVITKFYHDFPKNCSVKNILVKEDVNEFINAETEFNN